MNEHKDASRCGVRPPIGRHSRKLASALVLFAGLVLPATVQAQYVDTTFQPGTGANNYGIYDVAEETSGKLIIVGPFTAFNGVTKSGIARLNVDGSLDPTFKATLAGDKNTKGTIRGNAVAIQNDGRAVVGGYFARVNGIARQNIARLNSNGTLDASFTASVGGGIPYLLKLQADGKLFIAGNFQLVNGVVHRGYARLGPDGSLDPEFVGGLSTSNEYVNAVAFLPSGRILVAGFFNTPQGMRNTVMRLNPDGTKDDGFYFASDPDLWPIGHLALLPFVPSDPNASEDEKLKILIAVDQASIMQLSPSGTYESPVAESEVYGVGPMVTADDGSILAFGSSLISSNPMIRTLVRILPGGTVDSTIWPISTRAGTYCLTPTGSGLVVAGEFSMINGEASASIARLTGAVLSPENYPVHLDSAQAASVRTGNLWRATVQFIVRNAAGQPEPGVQVSARWTAGRTNPADVISTSDSSGQCTFTATFSRSCYYSTLTLTGVHPASGSWGYYDPVFDDLYPTFGNDGRAGVTQP